MARKWHTFHHTVESFFLKLIPSRVSVFRIRTYRLLVLLLLSSVGISPVLSQIPVNQSQKRAEELVEQVVICYENEKISEVLESLNPEKHAQKLVEQGQICYRNGQISEAVNYLQRAIDNFETQNDWNNLAITSTNLSRIFQELGRYTRACSTLIQALGLDSVSAQEPDSDFCQNKELTLEDLNQARRLPIYIQVSVWRSFGDVLRAIGRLKESERVLEKALNLADEPNALAATRLSLGNTYRAWGNLERDRKAEPKYEYVPWRCEEISLPEEALKHYQEADKKYKKVVNQVLNNDESIQEKLQFLQIKAKLNRLSLLLVQKEWKEAKDLSSQIKLDKLPLSQSRVYARINYAKNLACLEQKYPQAQHTWKNITHQIHVAIEEAEDLEAKRDLEDKHTLSYAIGNLGGLYEYLSEIEPKQQVPEFKKLCQKEQEFSNKAQCLTREALYRAQPEKAPDIAYQWQWQLGRLFEAEGQREEAIANYEAAIKTLESVRDDLLSINSDVQFNFRDNVEPLYRELVALLLPVGERNPSQKNLKKAVYYVDSLQLAELENFLRCNLQGNIEEVQIQQISRGDERIKKLFEGIDKILNNYPTKAAFIYPILLKGQISVILKLPGKNQKLEYHMPEIKDETLQEQIKDETSEEEIIKNTLFLAQKSLTTKIKASYDPEPLKKLYKWIIGEKFANKLEQNKIKNLIFVLDNYFRTIPMSALLDNKQFVVQKKYVTSVIPGVQLLRSESAKQPELNALIMGAKDTYDIETQINLNNQIDIIKNTLTDAKINFKTINEDDSNEDDYKKENLKNEIVERFYRNLDNQANISNSEALNFAQNYLIDFPPEDIPHVLPYHWAAFVLVGN